MYLLFRDTLPKGKGLIVVFDNYEYETAKSFEQKRRKGEAPSLSVDVKLDTAIPTDRKNNLSHRNSEGKKSHWDTNFRLYFAWDTSKFLLGQGF